jgi:hypothetical protein
MRIMKQNRWRSALGAALVVGLLGGCDFINPIESDPNAIPTASLDQILTAVEVNAFSFAEGQLARISAMWTQQMAGTDRQFVILDSFTFTEEEGDDYYNNMYTGGGLVDIREGIELASEAATARAQTISGILKIHEAFFIGMGASIWGDLVYTQAVNPDEYPQPSLDAQGSVYTGVQSVLDGAIADLQAGGSQSLSSDLVFGGDADAWITVANSLKARFYLHTGQLSEAIAAAQNGIASPDEAWMTLHSSSAAEDQHWWEFTVEQRSGYISTGQFLVDLLQDNADPRLEIYFAEDPAGGYSGSPPASSGADFSPLGAAFGSPDSETAIIGCAETQFIIAEAQQHLGSDPTAALNAGIACQEERWGIEVPTYSADALTEIMTQKYIANFLNLETWMDYRRTCLPAVRSLDAGTGRETTTGLKPYPARLYYADNETQNNTSIPTAGTAGNTLTKADMEALSGFWATYNASCLP